MFSHFLISFRLISRLFIFDNVMGEVCADFYEVCTSLSAYTTELTVHRGPTPVTHARQEAFYTRSYIKKYRVYRGKRNERRR